MLGPAKAWFETIATLPLQHERVFDKLCEDIEEVLLFFYCKSIASKKSSKTKSFHRHILEYMQHDDFTELVGAIEVVPLLRCRIGVSVLVQALGRRFLSRIQLGMAKRSMELRDQQQQSLDMPIREVNEFLGWAISSCRVVIGT